MSEVGHVTAGRPNNFFARESGAGESSRGPRQVLRGSRARHGPQRAQYRLPGGHDGGNGSFFAHKPDGRAAGIGQWHISSLTPDSSRSILAARADDLEKPQRQTPLVLHQVRRGFKRAFLATLLLYVAFQSPSPCVVFKSLPSLRPFITATHLSPSRNTALPTPPTSSATLASQRSRLGALLPSLRRHPRVSHVSHRA